jgi:hypothetical protein
MSVKKQYIELLEDAMNRWIAKLRLLPDEGKYALTILFNGYTTLDIIHTRKLLNLSDDQPWKVSNLHLKSRPYITDTVVRSHDIESLLPCSGRDWALITTFMYSIKIVDDSYMLPWDETESDGPLNFSRSSDVYIRCKNYGFYPITSVSMKDTIDGKLAIESVLSENYMDIDQSMITLTKWMKQTHEKDKKDYLASAMYTSIYIDYVLQLTHGRNRSLLNPESLMNIIE